MFRTVKKTYFSVGFMFMIANHSSGYCTADCNHKQFKKLNHKNLDKKENIFHLEKLTFIV